MAKLGTYPNEAALLVDDNDRLIGTDGGTGEAGTEGATKNFSVGVLKSFIAGGVEEGYIPIADSTGSYTQSTIQVTTPDGLTGDRLTVGGDIQFFGNLLDAEGNVLLVNTGSGDTPATVADPIQMVNVVNTSGVELNLFSVNVLTTTVDATVTLPSGLQRVPGSWLKISNLSAEGTTVTIAGGGSHFMNDLTATSLILDSEEASFELVYIDSTIGWVIIGAQSHA